MSDTDQSQEDSTVLFPLPKADAAPSPFADGDTAEARFRLMRARHAAVYCILHNLCSTVEAFLVEIANEKSARKRGGIVEAWVERLAKASLGLNEYNDAPPEEIAATYTAFVNNIASKEHLLENNRRLAEHYRAVIDDRAKVAMRLGLSKDALGEEIIAEIERQLAAGGD